MLIVAYVEKNDKSKGCPSGNWSNQTDVNVHNLPLCSLILVQIRLFPANIYRYTNNYNIIKENQIIQYIAGGNPA